MKFKWNPSVLQLNCLRGCVTIKIIITLNTRMVKPNDSLQLSAKEQNQKAPSSKDNLRKPMNNNYSLLKTTDLMNK